MTRLNVDDARREALFASGLQRSDARTAASVAEAISGAVCRFGTRGCPVRMARELATIPRRPLSGCAGPANSPARRPPARRPGRPAGPEPRRP